MVIPKVSEPASIPVQENNNVIPLPVGSEFVPPSNVELEAAILSSIMAVPNCLSLVSLEIEDFYAPVHQWIFEMILHVNNTGYIPDYLTLVDQSRLGKFAKRQEPIQSALELLRKAGGGLHYLSIKEHAKRIREKAQARKSIEVCLEAVKLFNSGEDVIITIQKAQQKLSDVASKSAESKLISLPSLLHKTYEQLEALNDGDNAIEISFSTGYTEIDRMTGGFTFGDISSIVATTGMGKTTFATDLFLEATRQGLPSVYFSIEMPETQVGTKVYANDSESTVPLHLMREKNSLKLKHWEKISATLSKHSEALAWVNDDARLTTDKIKADLSKVRADHGSVGFVVIDYLQLMSQFALPHQRAGLKTDTIANILQELRAIAKDFNCVMLCLAQAKPEVASRDNKRPTAYDVADSTSLAKDSSVEIFLYREEVYNPDTVERGVVEVIIGKNRFNETGTVKLLFEPAYGIYKNLPPRRVG